MATNRPTHKKTSRREGRRDTAIGGDVSGSPIVTGDHNVVQISSSVDALTTSPHQLRAPVGDFVGRKREIDTLINALRRESRTCITGISGMGGASAKRSWPCSSPNGFEMTILTRSSSSTCKALTPTRVRHMKRWPSASALFLVQKRSCRKGLTNCCISIAASWTASACCCCSTMLLTALRSARCFHQPAALSWSLHGGPSLCRA
jgi:hypothetical protein